MSRTAHWIAAIAMAVALLAMASVRAADVATYALDPVHTRIQFAVDHAGFSRALGAISGSTGTLRFDPDDWTTAALQVEVPLARLDLGDDRWNRATLARSLLDAETHPLATFVSTRVEPLAADRARVHGTLSLRGVSREVVLEVRLNQLKRHPLPPFRRTVGFSATTTLSRADFGMTAWKSVIGDRVELRIEVEATRSRGNGEGVDAEPAPPTFEEPDAAPAAESEPPPEAETTP